MKSLESYSIFTKPKLSNPVSWEDMKEFNTHMKEAEGYKKAKEEEYPIRWGGEYNHCEIFKKHL